MWQHNCSKLEFDELYLVVAFPMNKDWFYVMSQHNKCWNDEVNPCPLLYVLFSTWIYTIKLIHLFHLCVQYVDAIFYYLRKKSKQQIHSKYQYTTTSCLFKTYIDNSSEYEDKIIDIMKGYAISSGNALALDGWCLCPCK